MASKKVFDLAVVTGKYQDNQGNNKSRYQNVGAVMETDDGSRYIMLARWFAPSGVPDFSGKGGESVLISMFEPRDRNAEPQAQAQPRQQRSQQAVQAFDDDVPF